MKFIKALLVTFLVLSSVFISQSNEANAASNVTIYLNDVKQSYSNTATIKNGTTLVPLRGVFEGLGAKVTWNSATKTIDATKGNTKIWLKIGSKTTKVNGKNVTIAVPAQVVKGNTLVPLRFISESLGAKVVWNQAAKTVNIYAGDYVIPSDDIQAIEERVVRLTNEERKKYGLAALQMDKPLMAAAREKSEDMRKHNYFSHTSPTFGSPFDRMRALGISYKYAGENIAYGQRSAEDVVKAWMNSKGHRENILNPNFTHIGVGYVKNGNIWTQQFVGR